MSRIFKNSIDALESYKVIQLADNFYCLSFEAMKMRSVRVLIEHHIKTGKIKPGDILIESSSGLYAECLAILCKTYHLGCVIVTYREAVDKYLENKLRLLGAHLEFVEDCGVGQDQLKRLARLNELRRQNPQIKWLQQYHNSEHYYGYQEIGQEIAEVFNEAIVLVGTVGSGCSTGGIFSRYVELFPQSQLIGIEPFGSLSFGKHSISPEHISGMGSDIIMQNIRKDLYHDIHWVTYEVAASAMKEIYRNYGISLGITGAVSYYIAQWYRGRTTTPIVFISPTQDTRYKEDFLNATIFDVALTPKYIETLKDIEKPWSMMTCK